MATTNTDSIILDGQSQALGFIGWVRLLERQEPSPLSQLILRFEMAQLEEGIVDCAVRAGEEMRPCEPNDAATRNQVRMALMAAYPSPMDYFTHLQPLAAYVVDGRMPGEVRDA